MPSGFADFELGLIWDRTQQAFDVSLRFASVDAFDWPAHPNESLDINVAALAQLANDEAAYGKALTEMVFRLTEVAEFYQKAMAAAQNDLVHFRIHIHGPSRFHAVHWESLRDPVTGSRIATSRNILLSRYLSGTLWPAIPARTSRARRALIVIAAPSDISDYAPRGRRLADIKAEEELGRAKRALRNYHPLVTLAGAGQATLTNIVDQLERFDDGFDVVCILAHGAFTDDVPLLFLEHPDGTTDPVNARRLEERIADLRQKPTLVALLSCQSAGAQDESHTEDEGAFAAIGPRLARAGVAAVVAMQGNITMRSVCDFGPAFFAAYSEDGIVDRAMAVGRDAIRDRPDWWVPVLFSRLRSGRSYYMPEFTERSEETWQDLALMIRTKHVTPVLGSGLADGILGSREEIARRWVRRWQMPIAPHGHRDFAKVAQYIRVGHTTGRVSTYLQDYLKTELFERKEKAQGDDPFLALPDELIEGNRPELTIREVGRQLRARDPGDPYRVVASLPAKVFITTAWTELLQDALREREPARTPVTLCFPWTDRVDWDQWEAPQDLEPPTEQSPWVYHLFGRLDDPDSLVLTEDDYFEWLTAWIQKRRIVPPAVLASLTKNGLLFLGHRLDDWDFRVVFQSIKSFGGAKVRLHQHIGVQLKPETELIEPEAAQKYLESYFSEDQVSIFWAPTRRFLDELRVRTGISS